MVWRYILRAFVHVTCNKILKLNIVLFMLGLEIYINPYFISIIFYIIYIKFILTNKIMFD